MVAILKTTTRAVAVLLTTAALAATATAGTGPTPVVPEIDPGAAVGAMTLLIGGVLTMADRRRSK